MRDREPKGTTRKTSIFIFGEGSSLFKTHPCVYMSGGLYLLLPLMETVCRDPPYLVHSFLVLGELPDLVFSRCPQFLYHHVIQLFPISFLGSSLSRFHRHVCFVQKTVSSPLLVWMCANKSGRSCIYIYIYMLPPPPNVDMFVAFNVICGVLCLCWCFGESGKNRCLTKVYSDSTWETKHPGKGSPL